MAEKENIRSYEVSIWTLQDRFLSVLKWAEIDCKGQIQEPEVVLNDDGTEEFSFAIPKYYYLGAERMLNPMWLCLENQPLEANMHKLKVIFNKQTPDERVFEFLVTEVTYTHEQDNVTIEVKSEGLAFHELGKIGYKISLSIQNYLNALDAWTSAGTSTEEPINNIQFWNDLIFKDSNGNWRTNWTYEVQMDWSSFSNSIEGIKKRSDRIYDDEYVTSWTVDENNKMYPKGIEATHEKRRIIESSESNIYNLTQTIAEQFTVFCRYEYEHNQNYEITGRKVIYYNNYLYDIEGHIDLTYPYSSTAITRTVDSNDIISKMFVKTVSYNDQDVTIMDLDANKSGEDYLLNFDYLHDIQAITDEQYDEVSIYEAKLHEINDRLIKVSNRINAVSAQLITEKAIKKTYEEAIKLDSEQYEEAGKMRASLTDGKNVIQIIGEPMTLVYSADYGFYIMVNNKYPGLECSTVKLYKSSTLNNGEKSLDGPITSFSFTNDGFQNVMRIDHIAMGMSEEEAPNYIYLSGYYNPKLAYDKVQEVWEGRLARDQRKYNQAEWNVNKLEYYLNGDPNAQDEFTDLNPNLYNHQEALLAEKAEIMDKFERMMGPALREGYWNPEDYNDYGGLYTDEFTVGMQDSDIIQGNSGIVTFTWDHDKYYEGEEPLIYSSNTAGDLEQHLIIDVSDCIDELIQRPQDICVVYCNPSNVATIKEIQAESSNVELANEWLQSLESSMYESFRIGSDCELAWISQNGVPDSRRPVLICTGAQTLDDDTVDFICTNRYVTSIIDAAGERVIRRSNEMTDDEYKSFIGFMKRDNEGNIIFNEYIKVKTIGGDASAFIGQRHISDYDTPQDYIWVRDYPRFYFDTLKLKTAELAIILDETKLENYKEYTVIQDDRYDGLDVTASGYYVTLKPEVMFNSAYETEKNFILAYSLSNLDVAIYLDALKIMSENSKPKVSYEVELSVLNPAFIYTAYNRLNQIVHINDVDLQLNYVSGYISTVTMHLDKFWEDTVEIKNYETKFEDLFSNIVAQTQAMERASGFLSALMNGSIVFNPGVAESIFQNNADYINGYLDEYLGSSQFVKDRLREIFFEAGDILANASSTLHHVGNLTLENASILSSFQSKILDELVPKVQYSPTQPKSFKTGDVWIQTDPTTGAEIGRYVATADSADSDGEYGYTRTYDGTLAAIKGANLEIDAVAGTVSILAKNQINLKSGGNIYIAANENVDIVGNKVVNIGGTTINIATAGRNINGENVNAVGGINLVSSAVNFDQNSNPEAQINAAIASTDANISKVIINPKKIEMTSANVIMRGSDKIQMIAAIDDNITTTSALSISPSEGIWIGSGAGVRLYSGDVELSKNSDGTRRVTGGSGASVELTPVHLLLGVSSQNSTTGIEMTDSQIVIAAGADFTRNVNGTSSGLIGAKFTKDSIGFATSGENGINAILMNSKGVTVASGSVNVTQETADLRTAGGSYVRIAGEGIDIGSLANLYVNATNFKLYTRDDQTILAVGSALENMNKLCDITGATYSTVADSARLLVNKNGVFIKGVICATELQITPTVARESGLAVSADLITAYVRAGKDAYSGFSIDDTGIEVTSTGSLLINTTNVKINPEATGNSSVFEVKNANSGYYIKYTGAGILEVKGNITANSLTLTSDAEATIFNSATANSFITQSENRIEAWVRDGTKSAGWSLTENGLIVTSNTSECQFYKNGVRIQNSEAATDEDETSPGLRLGTNENNYLRLRFERQTDPDGDDNYITKIKLVMRAWTDHGGKIDHKIAKSKVIAEITLP